MGCYETFDQQTAEPPEPVEPVEPSEPPEPAESLIFGKNCNEIKHNLKIPRRCSKFRFRV